MLIHNISIYSGRDEVSSIQHQMQQLKLNPYPELPVVPDESKSVNSEFDAPGSSSPSGCYETKNPSSSMGCQQASSSHQFESSSVRISAAAAQNWSAASNNYADYGKFQPHQQQQSWASGDQQQQQAAQMAYQFMQIMEKSVNQIVSVPHFGFEWVTPDYQFDALSPIVDGHQVPPEQEGVVEEPPKALTPHTMKELFDALEEYSDLVEPV